jgi:Beta propeller domain/Dockerin type I domain
MAADTLSPIAVCRFDGSRVMDVTANHAHAVTSTSTTATNSANASESNALHFQTEADAVAKLTERAVKQWSSSFGKNSALINYDLAIGSDSTSMHLASAVNYNYGAIPAPVPASPNYTNAQSVGVDESDIAAFSDDGYVFVFRDQLIRIIDIKDPKNLKEVSRIELPGQSATMHLVGDKLVVISQGFDWQTALDPSSPRQYTEVKFFDVTDRGAPVITGTMKMEGSISASRVVNGQLVLFQSSRYALPQLLTKDSSTPPDVWASRYETQQEYLDRITPTILDSASVRYQQLGPDGKETSSGVIGDWRDIADTGGESFTTIVALNLDNEIPTPSSVETVLGGWVSNNYVTEKSVYLTFGQSDGLTRIVHLSLGNENGDFDISADGFGDVKGTIRNSRFLDEFDGYLRVVTSEDGSNSGGRIRNSANVFVMKFVDGELKTIGSVLDISPGDQAFSVEFDGERALVTTGFIQTYQWRDPLHGIDLSDPTQPKELSDVVIPGINNYVHWVDSNHLLGVGMVEEDSLWYTQVSLYDVTDLSAPKTIDVWRGNTQISQWSFGANQAMDIRYDAQSKTLTLPQSQNRFFRIMDWPAAVDVDSVQSIWTPAGLPNPAFSDVLVLSIDVEASDPITLRAEVGDGSGMGRAVVVGDTLVALTNMYLSTYATDDPTKVLDRILLSNPLNMDTYSIAPGTQKTILDVLANDSRLVDYKITSINGAILKGSVRILADQRLEYTNPTSISSSPYGWNDFFEYEVTTADGTKFKTNVSIYGQPFIVEPQSDATATVSLKALDDANNPVTSTAKGDEFWVEVLVQDGRSCAEGVFSAYVDLAFDTNAFEIVGDAEHTGYYTNGVSGEKTDAGWKNLGGFSNSPTPIGFAQQTLVRFRLRATKDAPLNITLSPSSNSDMGSKVALYGIDTGIPDKNITFGSLQLPTKATSAASLSLKAHDAENKPVVSSAKGDEFWVEVTLNDERTDAQGVYSAYVDVAFDANAFEIVGDAESLGDFTNKFSGEKTSQGWENLGGFRNFVTPAGVGTQSLVRFKVRATEDAVLNMTVSPSNRPGSELTLYGIDTVIPLANITSGSLQLPITPAPKVIDYDVNADGIVSPIDSLIVINRLNRASVDAAFVGYIPVSSGNIKLDVNQDGIISLLDVLTVVNRINEPVVSVANATVPMMNTVETNSPSKKK